MKLFFHFKKFIKDIIYVLGHNSSQERQNGIPSSRMVSKNTQRYTKNATQRTAGSRMILKDAFQIKSPVRTKPTHSFTLCLNLFLRYIFFFSFPKTGSPLEQMESCAWASPVWAHAAWGPSFAASESTCCTDHTPV